MKINIYNLYITDLYIVNGYGNDYKNVYGTGLYKKTTNMSGYDKVVTLYISVKELIPLSDVIGVDDIKVSKRKVLQKLHF